jgi:serine/threonine-protein kinase
MEYLEGVALLPLLRKLSKDGLQLELGFIAGVIQQATDALHYAHELNDRSGESLGIVHRDVTPSNIFLTESGVAKLLDFGIAKVKNASAHTQTGTVKGKYAYMAPEQLRGVAVDRRADVFALGVVLYEMLALRRLFQRKTDYLTFRAVLEQPIIDVRRYRPDCPHTLATVLMRALDREPANRFESASALGSAVVDAIRPLQRPWTQGQIGEVVRAHFAHNIHQRSQQIASALRGGPARQTIPLIAQPDEETVEIEGGMQELAPVDSPPSMPSGDGYPASADGERTDVETAPQLDVLRGVQGPPASPQPIVVVNARRSLLWPLFALIMVGIAGGALYLVWRKPPSITVNNLSDSRVVQAGPKVMRIENAPEAPQGRPGEPGSASAPGSAAEPASADAPGDEAAGRAAVAPGQHALTAADRTRSAAPRKHAAPEPSAKVAAAQPSAEDAAVQKALNGTEGEVKRCEKQHGATPPGTLAVVTVDDSGAVKRVAFIPDSLDATPLGSCIAAVLRTVAFPHGEDGRKFKIMVRHQA